MAAWIALMRHFAQIDADRQRRITESFSKAVEQLAHEKTEVRLGGIYTLERIIRESPREYWTAMEILTAFVRMRPWPDGATEPPADVAAVLAVISRRPEQERNRERRGDRWLDLMGAYLRSAYLEYAHLEGIYFDSASLAQADLRDAHLEGARFTLTHLEHADLRGAHLEDASLLGALLKGADVEGAHFEGANLSGADLEDVDLSTAHGNAETRLPAGFPRPAHWPAAKVVEHPISGFGSTTHE